MVSSTQSADQTDVARCRVSHASSRSVVAPLPPRGLISRWQVANTTSTTTTRPSWIILPSLHHKPPSRSQSVRPSVRPFVFQLEARYSGRHVSDGSRTLPTFSRRLSLHFEWISERRSAAVLIQPAAVLRWQTVQLSPADYRPPAGLPAQPPHPTSTGCWCCEVTQWTYDDRFEVRDWSMDGWLLAVCSPLLRLLLILSV